MRRFTKERFGEWAVITGASSGIGKEMARYVAKFGINTLLVARSEEELKSLAQEIKQQNSVDTKIVVADLSKESEVQKVIDAANGLEVGLLINSAGYALTGEFANNSLSDELDMLNLNLKAPLILSHHFAKEMKQRERGGILFLSSIMALAGAAKWANYSATKAHNLILAEGLAQELKKYNVNVTALIVGPVESGFQKRSHSKSPFFAMSPQRVAKWGLFMLTCKRTYVVGFINKLITLSIRLNPRVLNTIIFSAVVNRLTKGVE